MFYGSLIERMRVTVARVSPDRGYRASVAATTAGPWDLAALLPGTLTVAVDGGGAQTVTVTALDVAVPGAVTAAELAALITAGVAGGEAWTTADGTGLVLASTTAVGGTVQVTGGTLNAALLVPTVVVDGGYDTVMGGYLPYDDGTVEGAIPRREVAPVTLPCQVFRGQWGREAAGAAAGGDQVVQFTVVLHRPDLEAASLFDADGAPLFQRGDRIVAITETGGTLVERFPDPPGTFVVGVVRGGYGLGVANGNRTFNLVMLECARRDVR